MKQTRILSHYHKELPPHLLSNLQGEIYECYCYEIIVNKYKKIKFINLDEDKKNKDGFYITSNNSLCYQSCSIDLGEFDIIGLDSDGNVHWYEITKQRCNFSSVIDKLKRKKELMKILFGKYNLYLITPEKRNELQGLAGTLIIPEPDYSNLIKKEYVYNFKYDNFVNLEYLNSRVAKYNYIEDLMKHSHNFFSNKNTIYKSDLFERLYDLNNILNDTFQYYNVEKNCFGTIKTSNGKIIKDGKRVNVRKAAYKEITQIRRMKQSKINKHKRSSRD